MNVFLRFIFSENTFRRLSTATVSKLSHLMWLCPEWQPCYASAKYRLEDDGECTVRSKCTVEAVWDSSGPAVPVDRQLAVRGAQTDMRAAG